NPSRVAASRTKIAVRVDMAPTQRSGGPGCGPPGPGGPGAPAGPAGLLPWRAALSLPSSPSLPSRPARPPRAGVPAPRSAPRGGRGRGQAPPRRWPPWPPRSCPPAPGAPGPPGPPGRRVCLPPAGQPEPAPRGAGRGTWGPGGAGGAGGWPPRAGLGGGSWPSGVVIAAEINASILKFAPIAGQLVRVRAPDSQFAPRASPTRSNCASRVEVSHAATFRTASLHNRAPSALPGSLATMRPATWRSGGDAPMFRAHSGAAIAGKAGYALGCVFASLILVVSGFADYAKSKAGSIGRSDCATG